MTGGSYRDETATPADVAAQAVRRLSEALLTARRRGVAEPDVAAEIAALADRVESLAGEPRDHVGGDPVVGRANPVAPPLEFDTDEDGSSVARIEFALQYQGPPGFLHGGVSGLVLDAAMSRAVRSGGVPATAVETTLRYLRPTPLHTAVVVRGRHVRTDGERVFTEGTIEIDGVPTVACEAVFVAAGPTP